MEALPIRIEETTHNNCCQTSPSKLPICNNRCQTGLSELLTQGLERAQLPVHERIIKGSS